MIKEPEYIFYPMIPLRCFSNKQVFHLLAKNKKEIEKLKKTRAIVKKKE